MSTVTAYGDRAVLIDGLPNPELSHIVQAATDAFPGLQVRAGLNTILVASPKPVLRLLPQIQAWVDNFTLNTENVSSFDFPKTHVVDVSYTGADLSRVAAHLSMTEDEVVVAHTTTTWRVALIGFAPGFPYLIPVDTTTDWFVPRLATPRTQVPAGAVALAAGMSAIYPTLMPGGWNILGTTTTTLFYATNPNPSLLAPGDLVQFRGIS